MNRIYTVWVGYYGIYLLLAWGQCHIAWELLGWDRYRCFQHNLFIIPKLLILITMSSMSSMSDHMQVIARHSQINCRWGRTGHRTSCIIVNTYRINSCRCCHCCRCNCHNDRYKVFPRNMIENDMRTHANTHLISSRSQINSCNVLKNKVMWLQYSQIIYNWPLASSVRDHFYI